MGIALEFTDADRRNIEWQRGAVYFLEGLSLADLKSTRNRRGERCFHFDWSTEYANTEPSLKGQVAIFPEDPMLPGGYRKTLEKQLELVTGHAEVLDLIHAQAIVGTIATIAGALFAHADSSERYLLPQVFARSMTPVKGSELAIIGNPDYKGFSINKWPMSAYNNHIGVFRLVVPVRRK